MRYLFMSKKYIILLICLPISILVLAVITTLITWFFDEVFNSSEIILNMIHYIIIVLVVCPLFIIITSIFFPNMYKKKYPAYKNSFFNMSKKEIIIRVVILFLGIPIAFALFTAFVFLLILLVSQLIPIPNETLQIIRIVGVSIICLIMTIIEVKKMYPKFHHFGLKKI